MVMMYRILTASSLTLALYFNGFGQSLEHWSYEREAIFHRKEIKHRSIEERDVKYHKRVDRIIDFREKKNVVMKWPKNPYAKMLLDAANKGPNREGGIPVYRSDSLDQAKPLQPTEVKELGVREIVINTVDPFGDVIDTVIQAFVTYEDIKKIRIMEDWIFDAAYGDFRPRIVAIAPIYEMKTSTNVSLGDSELFWVKYEDLRSLHARSDVFNPFNDAARLTYDEWFEMRHFSSYIVHESNVWDLDIKHQPEFQDNALAARLDSERIKNDLFITEHDNWEY
jgi:gliding motility associated protien GldN